MKKKILTLAIIFCMILSCTGYANDSVSLFAVSGKGTENNPFRITNEEELLLLADFPECYFELENDIVLSKAWEPIYDFSGSLDGKGHTITVSQYIQKTNMGFFGILSGVLKNITFNANELKFANSNRVITYNGIIAGQCSGSIANCKVTGNITEESNRYFEFGVVCAVCSGSIEKTTTAVVISSKSNSDSQVSGFCCNLSGTISECVISNEVTTSSNYYGFTYNISSSGTIINSYNSDKSVNTKGSYSGIAYYNKGKIINCYNRCVSGITSSYKCGIADEGTKANCYYDKVVLGNTSTSYGIPKSTLAMKMQATYQNWDFENIWAIDESEENPINDGYPYLKWVYNYEEQPITFSSVKSVSNNLVFDIKITDITDTYMLHIALYNSNDELCDYIIIPNERQLKDAFVVFPDNKNAIKAKIFTWDGENQLNPIAKNELIEIIR